MKDNSSAFNSSIYDSKVNAVLPYYTEYNRQILDLAEASGIKNSKWLDTGCGTGNLALRVTEKFADVKLVLSVTLRQKCLKRQKLSFQTAKV